MQINVASVFHCDKTRLMKIELLNSITRLLIIVIVCATLIHCVNTIGKYTLATEAMKCGQLKKK